MKENLECLWRQKLHTSISIIKGHCNSPPSICLLLTANQIVLCKNNRTRCFLHGPSTGLLHSCLFLNTRIPFNTTLPTIFDELWLCAYFSQLKGTCWLILFKTVICFRRFYALRDIYTVWRTLFISMIIDGYRSVVVHSDFKCVFLLLGWRNLKLDRAPPYFLRFWHTRLL